MSPEQKVWDWRSYIINYAPDNATYKHVLLTLSCFMDSTGSSCFPSIKKLSETTSLGRTTVIKYLNKADEDGWIKKSVHGFSGQGWKRNEYTASIPRKVVQHMNDLDEGGSSDEEGGSSEGGKAVQQVDTTSPKNSPGELFTHKLQKLIQGELEKVQEMEKQPTYEECEKLVEKFGANTVKDVLLDMENFKGLNDKYTSVYLTARNWCKRHERENNEDRIKKKKKPKGKVQIA